MKEYSMTENQKFLVRGQTLPIVNKLLTSFLLVSIIAGVYIYNSIERMIFFEDHRQNNGL